MVRTHSSATASPTRFRSPRRSPSRGASQDGSQYEMDLDALGLNSTFESTELEGRHEPPVDQVFTSEIEGPEDFTMNMTYWMTADLPVTQIKSRKEASAIDSGVRMDATQTQNESQDATEEGDRVIAEHATSGSPSMRVNSTTDVREHSTPASERSMENDEKVRSFLSALPDTDMEDAITGTPVQTLKQSFLQVPRSSPPKARSLQPTVEDYDTPRKLTQGTVIHHVSAMVDNTDQDTTHDQVAELRLQLEQQSLASKTRVTELETILSYTRTELETARNDNYKHKSILASLEQGMEQQREEMETARLSAGKELKARDEALETKMREFGEEMRLQNLAKLEYQRESFESQIRRLKEEATAKDQVLVQAQEKIAQHTESKKVPLDGTGATESRGDDLKRIAVEEHERLVQQLSSVQARAESLQAELEKVNAEVKTNREEGQKKDARYTSVEAKTRAQTLQITSLKSQLQTMRFELECAQTENAAKQQLFHTNLDLNSSLRTLRSELDTKNADSLASDRRQSEQAMALDPRITSLRSQIESTRADLSTKDQQILSHIQDQEILEQRLNSAQGRIEGLETTIGMLRQQLAEAHRESAKLRTETERCQGDLVDANDRLSEARAETDRRMIDADKKLNRAKELKLEAESKLKDLQLEHQDLAEKHEAMMDDIRDRAEDAVRKAGALLEQERNEKKRVVKDLKKVQEEASRLRTEAARRLAEEEDSSDNDTSTSISTTGAEQKDTEIANLRAIIRKQIAEMKALRSTSATLKKDNQNLKFLSETSENSHSGLETQITQLQLENNSLKSSLEEQRLDFEAVNKDMDERLASMLSKLVKERAKSAVGKRDVQWAEAVGKVQSEKELLGKVLLRQWGREENGIADEASGERQTYGYKYVKRS